MAETIEHDENETQQAPDKQVGADTESAPAELVEENGSSPLHKRSALVPVSERGVAPATLAQQIDLAQYMAKARLSLPAHLHNNPGDCLAILDIASRARMSPYMMAMKTYEQGGKLCFESQLFHALLEQSGQLIGRLRVKYDGEGAERTCTVWGTLRGEAEPHYHTSPPLKLLHPGHTTKTRDGVQLTFVKGSPLWDKKPDVQMFYDTSRDWVRLYCPTAALGIFSVDELQQYPDGVDGAIDVTDKVAPDLHARLKGGNGNKKEGHREGHATGELARVAAGDRQIKPARRKAATKPAAQKAKSTPKAGPKAKPATTPRKAAATPSAKAAESKPKEPEKSAIQQRAEREQAGAPNGQPKSAADYGMFARNWIEKGKSRDDVCARWEGEREMRDDLQVPMKARKSLEELIEKLFPAGE